MKEYVYKFADGTKSVVRVDDELYKVLKDMDKKERYGNRRETRRHISLDEPGECGIEPAVSDTFDFWGLFSALQNETLFEAVESLDAKQKKLLQKVFYECKRLKEIAEEEKVSPQLVSWRLSAILAQLGANR